MRWAGFATSSERSHFACDTVIYVGDDITDEDVFQLDRPGQLLSIRVGRKQTSAAPYYIRNQAEIDRLLETLVALRGGGCENHRQARPRRPPGDTGEAGSSRR